MVGFSPPYQKPAMDDLLEDHPIIVMVTSVTVTILALVFLL
jgi:hypothetical protein